MKKLLVVLLALACVGAVSAQVTTSLAASGTLNIAKATANNTGAPLTGIAEDGEWYDALTFAATDKDGNFGGKVYVGQFDAAVLSAASIGTTGALTTSTINVLKCTNWDVWYKYDFGKIDIGTAGGGFNSDLNNDIVDHWDVDGFGTGAIFTSPDMGGLTFDVYLNAPTTAINTVDALKQSGASVQYVVENSLKVQALVNAGLVSSNTKANAYVNFTGVENLVVYGDVQWDQTNADSLAAFGGQYVAGPVKAIAEFESNWGGSTFLFDVVGQATYKINDNLSARLRACYDASAATSNFYAKVYALYAVGNGLGANLMVGYDQANSLIYQLYCGYAVSL